MTDIRSIEPGKYNLMLAKAIKELEHFKAPEWAFIVKTSANRQRPNIEEDFWYKRTASILRQIYIKGVIGVQRLRTRYGGRKKRGSRPDHFYKASGKMIRLMLQQAESAGLVEKAKGKRAGRMLTKKGRDFLESVAR